MMLCCAGGDRGIVRAGVRRWRHCEAVQDKDMVLTAHKARGSVTPASSNLCLYQYKPVLCCCRRTTWCPGAPASRTAAAPCVWRP